MVLCPKTPVNVWKDGLVFITYCAKDTATYSWSLLTLNNASSNRGGLSAFSTNLAKKYRFFDIKQIHGKVLPSFANLKPMNHSLCQSDKVGFYTFLAN